MEASTTLAGAAIVLTAVDAAANGLQLKHTIDVGLTVISIAKPELAPVIFVANLVGMAVNRGNGIFETIQDAVKNQDYPTQFSKPAF